MSKVKPKKHLGQHFLRDQNIAFRIVKSLTGKNYRHLVEIGPGTGVLTKYLIHEEGVLFKALDVDLESVNYLKNHHPIHSDLFLHRDFLLETVEPETAIIGNFPYNISSQIFFKVWENWFNITEVVGMIQKEVAERIASSPNSKNYGILSVLLQTFFHVQILFDVPPQVFDPPPKVHSSVIQLIRNDRSDLGGLESLFKTVVKRGFGKRRKTLRNALKDLNLSPKLTEDQLFDLRAEQLSVEDFIMLTRAIHQSSFSEA